MSPIPRLLYSPPPLPDSLGTPLLMQQQNVCLGPGLVGHCAGEKYFSGPVTGLGRDPALQTWPKVEVTVCIFSQTMIIGFQADNSHVHSNETYTLHCLFIKVK
jgi:hypothetical protein